MRVRIEGYTQKNSKRDTIKVFKPIVKRKEKNMAQKAHSLSHTKWMCKYHIVFTPKYSVSCFMGYLKGKSTLMLFDRHANLKYKFGNRHFESEGFYVSTVGVNDVTVRKYIQEQENIILCRINLA